MFTIDQTPWHEMDMGGSLICHVQDPYWQSVEKNLRQQIYKWEHCPADMVLLPCILIPHIYRNTGYGLDVKEERLVADAKSDVAAHLYQSQFFDLEDVQKIQIPHITPCPDDEKQTMALAAEIFAGIAPAVFQGTVMHLGFWDFLSQWLGVENAWAFGMAQIFSSVSPEVTREFEVPYMQEVYSHFGSIYYGCCERLDDRLDVVEQMPNIRKVSCSPWSNREHFASVLSKKYIMSAKSNPAFLAAEQFDEELIRLDLRRTIRAARKNGLGLEFLLKDLSTVQYKPERIWRWSEIAAEETAGN